jgi:integrase
VPKVELLPGETRRDRVITPQEEARYLAAATTLVSDVASVLFDTGMRPDELHRIRWQEIRWPHGRNGAIFISQGKTAAARRLIPVTLRVRNVLDARWESQGRPEEGWVWPAPTKTGHIDHSSTKKQHRATLKLSGVRPFPLYVARHTFLTRLGASGAMSGHWHALQVTRVFR